MKFGKKVVVAVSLDEELKDHLKSIKHMDFLAQSEIHLVHVFNTISYAIGFAEAPLIYPVQQDRAVIEKEVLSQLRDLSRDILPLHFSGKIIYQCLFHDNPKEKFCLYVENSKADLAVIATRRRRGLFESSFAHYVGKHSDCHQILLKEYFNGDAP